MSAEQYQIPTEVYLDFLGTTIPIHWHYHAYLMFGIWVVLVPLCIISIRFFKPKPKGIGITTKVKFSNPKWWWFTVHKYGLYTAVGLSVGGVTLALLVSQGFSGTAHSMFGITTVTFACIQVISSLMRGKHGGKYYATANPEDPATWFGDHYNFTTRRRIFEAYHKSAGYFTIFFAAGAVGSGLMQYRLPVLLSLAFIIPIFFAAVWIVLQYMGRNYDGYRAVFGPGMEHPYNAARKDL